MLPERIKEWLRQRGITDEAQEKYKLDFNGANAIVIPIRDQNNKILFFKFRKDPSLTSNDVPKYWYEKGHKVALYNESILADVKHVIICEGEFDCIVLNSLGFPAVTSTGGAGTFPDSWVEKFAGKQVYICMDTDDAGRKAAVRLLFMFPGSKLIALPKTIKDVTDYFVMVHFNKTTFIELMQDATEWPELQTTGDTDLIAKNTAALRAKNIPDRLYWVKDLAIPEMEKARQVIAKIERPEPFTGKNTLIQWAKDIPLENFFGPNALKRIGGKLRAICPFHGEKTGSFFIYPKDNSWYCYGCSQGGDTIDFIMKRDSCDFNEALKTLKK